MTTEQKITTIPAKSHYFTRQISQNLVQIKLSQLLDFQDKETICECIMILDNDINYSILEILQQKCQHLILVDGGANRLYQSKLKDSKKINCIIGDLDGIKKEVYKYYEEKGVSILKDSNQDTTDFQKSLIYAAKLDFKNIIYLNFFPGRIDHVFASMHNSQKHLKKSNENHILLIGKNSVVIYMHQQRNYILDMNSQFIEKKGCGLITFGEIKHIETSGFRWNLGQKQAYKSLKWGQFISTSNQIIQNQVKIHSSDPVFFVGQLKNQSI